VPRHLRILQLVASSRGGGASHVRDLALRLDPARYDVSVAMPGDGGAVSAADFTGDGILFHQVNIASGASLAEITRLRRLLKSCDIVHVHGARAALFGRLAALSLGRRRPRIAYTIHGFAAPYYRRRKRYLLLRLERALAPLTDQLIAVCEAEKQAIVAAPMAGRAPVAVIYNGIAADRYWPVEKGARSAMRDSLAIPPDHCLIISLCRLDRPRDFETLLNAFQMVVARLPKARLLIAGDGPLRPAIEKRLADLSLASQVSLLGWRTDAAALYAAADIYALTTWGWEGLPLTVLEAMAARLPVVATRAGGTPEVVVHGETGLLTPRQDTNALAGALTRLVAEPSLRRHMGEAGGQRVESLFSLERMVAAIATQYDALAANDRRALIRPG
jgi:glycosyltransferase involved in cell wall biosynthesis